MIFQTRPCIEKIRAAHNFSMMNRRKIETGIKIIKLSAAAAAVCLGMKFILPMALPFLIAMALARLLYPMAKILEERAGFRRAAARFTAYGAFLAAVGAAAAGAVYLCYCMGSNCLGNLGVFIEEANKIFCVSCDKLEKLTGFSTEEIKMTISREAGSLTDGAVKYSKDAGWYMMELLAKLFVAFIASFLILNDYETIRDGIKKTQTGRAAVCIMQEIKTASFAYLRAQICIMGIVTAVCVGGLFLLQIPKALGIGIAIGLFDALPFFGTGIIFVPWALLEMLSGRYKNALGFLAVYAVCNFIRQILEPRLVGSRLGIPPIAVLMSIYGGVWIYGGAGVILGPVSALLLWEIYKKLDKPKSESP